MLTKQACFGFAYISYSNNHHCHTIANSFSFNNSYSYTQSCILAQGIKLHPAQYGVVTFTKDGF